MADVAAQEGVKYVLEDVGYGVGPLDCLFRPLHLVMLGEPQSGLVLIGGTGPPQLVVLGETPAGLVLPNVATTQFVELFVPRATVLQCPLQQVAMIM